MKVVEKREEMNGILFSPRFVCKCCIREFTCSRAIYHHIENSSIIIRLLLVGTIREKNDARTTSRQCSTNRCFFFLNKKKGGRGYKEGRKLPKKE